MAEELRNMIHEGLVRGVAEALREDLPSVNPNQFVEQCMEGWSELSLTQRISALRKQLERSLSAEYLESRKILLGLATKLSSGYAYIFIPEFISENGLEYPKEALEDLEATTSFSSAEFAVRPFIRRYPQLTMSRMLNWTKHKNEHVRRLASEGCRPKLPWGGVLREFVEDPSPIVPILEALKDDPAVYVQKSVANNLNDISKDHPDLVLDLAGKWIGKSKRTDWILKRALRTLLKQGNPRALAYFGFHSAEAFVLESFELKEQKLDWAGTQEASYRLRNSGEKSKLRLEYRIHFVRKNGTGTKVFQISETELQAGEEKSGVFKQSFKDLSTRKHYPGEHRIDLIVNGVTAASHSFQLLA